MDKPLKLEVGKVYTLHDTGIDLFSGKRERLTWQEVFEGMQGELYQFYNKGGSPDRVLRTKKSVRAMLKENRRG